MAPGVYEMSQIRDTFGHERSRLITNNDGEAGRPIVLRTDPDVYDPENAVAVLDFGYGNRGTGANRRSSPGETIGFMNASKCGACFGADSPPMDTTTRFASFIYITRTPMGRTTMRLS